MPDHVLAERLLSVVMPRERAGAVVGDLLERVPQRGGTWFWLALSRTALFCVWRDLAAAPFTLMGGAVFAWFGYMLAVLLLTLIVGFGLAVLSLAYDVAAHHTALELVAGLLTSLKNQLAPGGYFPGAGWLVIVALAPFFTGTRVADIWRERAVALVAAMAVVWIAMIVLVPVAGFTARVSVGHLPMMVLFMLAGVVRQRSRRPSLPALPAR